jgi:CTP synthase
MSETVLIIEDDTEFAEALKLKVEENNLTDSVEIRNFENGMKELSSIAPNVVVLDIFEGEPQNEKREGLQLWEQVWEKSFIPLIFASASRITTIIEMVKKHPLVQYVVKTEIDAMDQIVNGIRQFLPFGSGIKEIRDTLYADAENTTQKALTETAQHTLSTSLNPQEDIPLLKSAARRRLSFLMRQKSEEEREHLFVWEQYVYPPITECLLTGDILKSTTGNSDDPNSFRVILTPSCDIANSNVSNVLVAHCVSIREYWVKCSLSNNKNKVMAGDRHLNRIKVNLNEAQNAGYKPLPKYSDLLPHMAVSLRDLELLSIQDGAKATSSAGIEYERIVSIDSPFREQLAWAYLQIAGRPGMPDRDIKTWISDILDHLST